MNKQSKEKYFLNTTGASVKEPNVTHASTVTGKVHHHTTRSPNVTEGKVVDPKG